MELKSEIFKKLFMKVLIVIPNLCVGGAEKHVLKLIGELNNENHDLRLLVLTDSITLKLDSIPSEKIFVLKGSFLFKLTQARKIIDNFKPYIVHSFLYKANIFSLFLKAKFHIWSIRNDKPFLKFSHCYRVLWFILAHFFPHKLLFVSESSYQSHSKFLFKNFNYDVIRNGIVKKPNIINLKKFKKGYLDVVLVGRNTFEKQFQPLINFINNNQHLSTYCRFHFIGRGCLELENNSNNVQLYGETNNLDNFYINKDVMIINSISEGFPNVFLEALVNNIVVLSRDVSDVKLFINDFQIYDNYLDLFVKLNMLFKGNLNDYLIDFPEDLDFYYMINKYNLCYTSIYDESY